MATNAAVFHWTEAPIFAAVSFTSAAASDAREISFTEILQTLYQPLYHVVIGQ